MDLLFIGIFTHLIALTDPFICMTPMQGVHSVKVTASKFPRANFDHCFFKLTILHPVMDTNRRG
jgi:hypothetical protein